jgi:hypothetical protein
MTNPTPKFDRRLLGTWKSDRRKTFERYCPMPGTRPEVVRKLKSLFGKLVVRWGRKRVYSELDGHRNSQNYEIIAADSESVVVRYFCDVFKEDRLQQIHFEGEYYWIGLGGHLCEYFRKIK